MTTILVLLLIVVSLAMIVGVAVDERQRVQAAERWPDNWHELLK